MHRIAAWIGLMMPISIAPALLVAYRDGPLPAKTGGFGEETCHQCHFDNPVNDPAGSLRLDGVPDEAIAGREYPIDVIVTRDGIARAGFELSARVESGDRAGAQAGVLHAPDDRTRVIAAPDSPVQYVQHTKAGSMPADPGEGRWRVLWMPPEQPVRVVFHVAANAANGDDSPLGDFIYVASGSTRVRADGPRYPVPDPRATSPAR